jgi:hypothetical protein
MQSANPTGAATPKRCVSVICCADRVSTPVPAGTNSAPVQCVKA